MHALAPHRPEDERHPAQAQLAERGDQRPGARGVVSAVQQHPSGAQAPVVEQLQAAGPADHPEPLADRRLVDGNRRSPPGGVVPNGIHQRKRDGGVGRLVSSQQADVQALQGSRRRGEVHEQAIPTTRPQHRPVGLARAGASQRDVERGAAFHDGSQSPSSRPGHREVPALDDARLLGPDLRERVAEIALMVVLDVGDGRHPQVEDVGGVEPAAQSHLHDHEVHR